MKRTIVAFLLIGSALGIAYYLSEKQGGIQSGSFIAGALATSGFIILVNSKS